MMSNNPCASLLARYLLVQGILLSFTGRSPTRRSILSIWARPSAHKRNLMRTDDWFDLAERLTAAGKRWCSHAGAAGGGIEPKRVAQNMRQ